MPRIFDNINSNLLVSLKETMSVSNKADFCVGYFSLTGWRLLDDIVENWPNDGKNQCRLLIGMSSFPKHIIGQELKAFDEFDSDFLMDQATAIKLMNYAAEEFRKQLIRQLPTNDNEAGLRRLARQLREKKLVIKLFLKHQLHAKLYLFLRKDPINPRAGFIGSSNLSFSGLKGQGELNIDVLDHDATLKLQGWFDDRWDERLSIDISEALATIIENSWVTEKLIPPYHIYLNIAYHLSKEARNGLAEFSIPKEFKSVLFDFQSAAVRIAAHHLNKRSGVLLGDVVGLGKTLMASAIAKIFQDDYGLETLILCPKNLVPMWEYYIHKYRLIAHIVPISQASSLEDLRRYRVAIIDESHNLRNRDGKRYKEIKKYLHENECKCILLSATPYNKSFSDISSQLRLFISEDQDLGIRPERKIAQIGEAEFIRQSQCSPRTLQAFEQSDYPDDWRDLMRLFMVRRTRTFIQENYAKLDKNSQRRYLTLLNGERSYFPQRIPKTVKYATKKNKNNQYAILYSEESVNSVISLKLPRYGLGNYCTNQSGLNPSENEKKTIQGLSRAGKRLIGICRTSLFKRLESGGPAFLKSLERHILKNFIFLYALENNLEIPIGSYSIEDSLNESESENEVLNRENELFENEEKNFLDFGNTSSVREHAKKMYELYRVKFHSSFSWVRSEFFNGQLAKDLLEDADELLKIFNSCGSWDSENDPKILALFDLIKNKHQESKILVFSQYADTVKYVFKELNRRGIENLNFVTGESENPAETAWRFSPKSNEKENVISKNEEIRVLITTDVLSEGVNLQDCSIIVNFDLPWAIIRLVQRAGRVDRIGQKSELVICYSFMPAEGIERILGLRARVRSRLQANAEVIGTDEAFFEDEKNDQPIIDIYNEKAGILDNDGDIEVDLASQAYQIWKNAIEDQPELASIIPNIAPVSYTARKKIKDQSEGVIVYAALNDNMDALAWVDREGKNISQSQSRILEVVKCEPNTPAIPRSEDHHKLVSEAINLIKENEFSIGGQLGRSTGPRYRAYERIKDHIKFLNKQQRNLFTSEEYVRSLERVMEEIYRFPLKESASDTLKRQLKLGISDEDLAELILALSSDGMLCVHDGSQDSGPPQIICSLGLL